MNIIQKITSKIDKFQRKRPAFSFPIAVIKKYGDDEAGHQAALIAYYGFLSLFPLLLVLTTGLKLFLRNDTALSNKIVDGATDYFPLVGNNLQGSVHGLDGTGLALFIGIALTLFGARGVADAFRSAVNHVWQVPYVRRTGFPLAILKSFAIIFVGGIGLLGAPILAGYAVSFGHNFAFKIFSLLITVAILFGLLLFLFKMALSVSRPIKELWVGALIAATGLMLLQSLGTYLLTSHLRNLNDLYGTFAVVLGLLYWIYLQTQILLYAIEIDSVRVLKLWPRAINRDILTDEDRKAFRLYAHRNRFHDEEEITVETSKKRSLLKRLSDDLRKKD